VDRSAVPERRLLYCDAPGCDEQGEYETFTLDGKTYKVILGPKHRAVLEDMAKWGRQVRGARAAVQRRPRRGTDEARLLSLLDTDERSPDGGRRKA
jgi:hypothetical protein